MSAIKKEVGTPRPNKRRRKTHADTIPNSDSDRAIGTGGTLTKLTPLSNASSREEPPEDDEPPLETLRRKLKQAKSMSRSRIKFAEPQFSERLDDLMTRRRLTGKPMSSAGPYETLLDPEMKHLCQKLRVTPSYLIEAVHALQNEMRSPSSNIAFTTMGIAVAWVRKNVDATTKIAEHRVYILIKIFGEYGWFGDEFRTISRGIISDPKTQGIATASRGRKHHLPEVNPTPSPQQINLIEKSPEDAEIASPKTPTASLAASKSESDLRMQKMLFKMGLERERALGNLESEIKNHFQRVAVLLEHSFLELREQPAFALVPQPRPCFCSSNLEPILERLGGSSVKTLLGQSQSNQWLQAVTMGTIFIIMLETAGPLRIPADCDFVRDLQSNYERLTTPNIATAALVQAILAVSSQATFQAAKVASCATTTAAVSDLIKSTLCSFEIGGDVPKLNFAVDEAFDLSVQLDLWRHLPGAESGRFILFYPRTGSKIDERTMEVMKDTEKISVNTEAADPEIEVAFSACPMLLFENKDWPQTHSWKSQPLLVERLMEMTLPVPINLRVLARAIVVVRPRTA